MNADHARIADELLAELRAAVAGDDRDALHVLTHKIDRACRETGVPWLLSDRRLELAASARHTCVECGRTVAGTFMDGDVCTDCAHNLGAIRSARGDHAERVKAYHQAELEARRVVVCLCCGGTIDGATCVDCGCRA